MRTSQTKLSLAVGLALVASAAAMTTAEAACVKAGGEATMVTQDLAEFMATAALKNSIAANGMAPKGKIEMTCKPATLSMHCVARQRACK